MKQPFWKLAECPLNTQSTFLQVLHDIEVNENTKSTLKIKCKVILKVKMENAKVRKLNHRTLFIIELKN